MKKITRRVFLTLGSLGFLGVTFGYTTAFLRSLFPNVLYEPSTSYKIGKPEKYPKDSTIFIEEKRIFITHDQNGLYAMSAECTHLGCNVRIEENGFNCPCHGSKFNKFGKVVKGPALRPLEFYALSLSARGDLIVDTKALVSAEERLKVLT